MWTTKIDSVVEWRRRDGSSETRDEAYAQTLAIIRLQCLHKEKSLILAIPEGHVELGGMNNPVANVDLV